jgi:S-adenosyl-L-methionine hydrolase (adenosine-forming)
LNRSIITLTTDFGVDDNYVGAMKAAILSINPEALVVDNSHGVLPQDIENGVYLASTTWPYYPAGCIHVAVVDPGVGTDRLPIILQTPHGLFVGPDNGLLSAALPPENRPATPGRQMVPQGYAAYQIEQPRYFRAATPSNTFHGRDIFAPVAAHLSTGLAPAEAGREINSLHSLPFTTAKKTAGSVLGAVLHVDHYGNLVTNIPADYLESDRISLRIGGQPVEGLGRTYGENQGLFALVTSDGWLAVAFVNGSAAGTLAVGRGATVEATW